MGMCQSSPVVTAEAARAKVLDAMLEESKKKSEQKVKMLLLGAGESGKSTIFKQLRILYKSPYSEDDRRCYKPVIFSNTILSMKTLVAQAIERGVTVHAQRALSVLADVADDGEIKEDVGTAIAELWADGGIQEVYRYKSMFHLNDSAKYYFDKVMDLASPAYVPTVDDVLRSRVRTSGIVEEEFLIEDVKFVVFDVGGQKNERKKWLHCFEDVTAVIFVASMSDYDQMMLENNCTNRMIDAQELFTNMVRNKWFEKSSMILFLNKIDLFKEKIRSIDLRFVGGDGMPSRFVDYMGGCDEDKAKAHIIAFFLSGVPSDKKVEVHCTCATDTQNVRIIFNTCKKQILAEHVKGSGFME